MDMAYICNVVPDSRRKVCRPLCVAVHIPPQVCVASSRLPGDPASLHLGKMAFEKTNLVLPVDARKIRAIRHHAEVIPHLARVDRRRGLRNEFGAAHRLSIPVRRGVQRELCPLRGSGVGRVLVSWREVDVLCYVTRTVDIVLVRSDFVRPGPVVEVRRRGQVVEAAIPEDSTSIRADNDGHQGPCYAADIHLG